MSLDSGWCAGVPRRGDLQPLEASPDRSWLCATLIKRLLRDLERLSSGEDHAVGRLTALYSKVCKMIHTIGQELQGIIIIPTI